MNRKLNETSTTGDLTEMRQVFLLLQELHQRLDEEVQAKQDTIAAHEQELRRLHKLLEHKNELLLQKDERLRQLEGNAEGNKQLINKLIGDIDTLHRDIGWYKRTYEKRRLAGIFFDRIKNIFGKSHH